MMETEATQTRREEENAYRTEERLARERVKAAKKKLHFFTVELKNGHVMSTPKYAPEQEFIGSLVQEVEQKKPEFAWFQFVFRRADYHSHLLGTKAELSAFIKEADTPDTKYDSEGKPYKVERKEKRTEWYRSASGKIKKIDAILSQPTIAMSIRGMWVGDVNELTTLGSFANCTDEVDGLVVVPSRDARILPWLADRRTVEPEEYLWNYGVKTRRASPSLMLTTAELPSYIHIPTGPVIHSLRSLADAFGGAVSPPTTKKTPWKIGSVGRRGVEAGEANRHSEGVEGGFWVASLTHFPALAKSLDEAGASRLKHLASGSDRTFELVYSKKEGKTEILVGAETSEDLRRYENLLSSLYGGISFGDVSLLPACLGGLVRELFSAWADPAGVTRWHHRLTSPDGEEGYYFEKEDFLSHVFVVGATGSGKTNLLLQMILGLLSEEGQQQMPCAVISIDPAGDASLLLAETLKDWKNLTIVDPKEVSFAFNPAQLFPPLSDKREKALQMQRQVEELVGLLEDVVKTDPALAPRLYWIYRGTFFFLYVFGDSPTFLDLYNFMTELSRRSKEQIAAIFRRADIAEEIYVKTMEAIAGLEKGAYIPILNRISNFVLPPNSYTARTFCARNTTLDLDEMMAPGYATILRLDKSLPGGFREMLTGALVMKIWFLINERKARLEKEGKGPEARTPVILFIDEFQNVQKLKVLKDVLSEGRKFGLSLVMANQYLQQLESEGLLEAILANAGTKCALRCSSDDATKLSKVLGEKYKDELVLLPKYHMAVLRNSQSVSGIQGAETWPIDPILPPVHTQDEVISIMRTEMEKKYGGAAEDRVPIFQSLLEEMSAEEGEPLMDFVNTAVVYYLHYWAVAGSPYRPTFSYIRWFFEEKFGWKDPTILHNALRKLEDLGFVKSAETMDWILAKNPSTGVTEWREPVGSYEDEVDRSKTIRYELAYLANEKFFGRPEVKGTRPGGPFHVRVMERYIEKYQKKFCWVTADYGEHPGWPDLMIFEPLEKVEVNKEDGTRRTVKNPYAWDAKHATAVEVERNPRKHQKQVLKNYEKCVEKEFAKIIFVVISEEHAEKIREILYDKDPSSYTVEVVKDLGFSAEALKKAMEEEERMEEGASKVEPEAPEEGQTEAGGESEQSGSQPSNGGTREEERSSLGAATAQVSSPPSPQYAAEGKSKAPHQNPQQEAVAPPMPPQPKQAEEEPTPKEPTLAAPPQPHRLSQAFMRKMVIVLDAVGRDVHSSEELASRLNVSRRQVLRYLNELASRGYVREEKKKYFITEKGRSVLQ
jgi:DNA helicase HerA-like ATPase/biotin operon repressor